LICLVCGKFHQKLDPDALYCGNPHKQEAYRRRRNRRTAKLQPEQSGKLVQASDCDEHNPEQLKPDPGLVRVNSVSRFKDFCIEVGGLPEWNDNNAALLANSFDVAMDCALVTVTENGHREMVQRAMHHEDHCDTKTARPQGSSPTAPAASCRAAVSRLLGKGEDHGIVGAGSHPASHKRRP
jgi:hypothetical protein